MSNKRYETPHILHDAPLRDEDPFHFHFDEFAITLARLIANPETRTPLTIGVSGPWGAGKTTLLRRVKKFLDEPQIAKGGEKQHSFANDSVEAKAFRQCKTVWFDAWKYDDEDELLVALVRVMLNAMQRDGLLNRLKAWLEDPNQASYDLVAMFINAFKFNFGGLGAEFEFNLDPKKHETPSSFEQHTAFFDHFEEAFERLLALWVHGKSSPEKIDEEKGVLVVFVDDLDRCLPKKTVQVLEAIKLFLDKEGAVFLLGADIRRVQEAVAAHYKSTGVTGESAADYLEKVIQLRFELPLIEEIKMQNYLEATEIIGDDWGESWKILITGAEVNPRKVKTFMNDLSLQWAALRNSGQAEGVNRQDFNAWQVLVRAAPRNFVQRVREQLDDRELRHKFVMDAIRWAQGDEELDAVFQDYQGSLRLRRVLRKLAFTDGFKPETLEAFVYLTAPPQETQVEKRAEAGKETALEDVGKGLGRGEAARRAGAQVWGSLEFVPVSGGRFIMGSKEDNELAYEDEHPQHTLEFPHQYWIGRFPVTNEQFAVFVETTGFVTTAEKEGGWNSGKSEFTKGFDWQHPLGPEDNIGKKLNHPVVQVSWDDAMAYCRWLNESFGEVTEGYTFRLPTEAEWEKVARGEFGNEWPWGNDWDKAKCNSNEGGPGGTTPVGAYSPQGDSPYGAADMVGNVWEWTHSLFKGYPFDMQDGREDEDDSGARVLRGGSFYK